MCPRCGSARGASLRWCPGCGLDYWELASQEAAPTAIDRPQDAAAHRSGGLGAVLMTLGGLAGVVAVCGLVLLVFSNVDLRGLGSGSRDLAVPPSLGTTQRSEAQLVVDAFLSEVSGPDVSFHVALHGTVEGGPAGNMQPAGTLTGDFDASGDDWQGFISVEVVGGRGSFAGDFVAVDGSTWVRPVGGAGWIAAPSEPGQEPNPFRHLRGRSDLEYVGAETRDGQKLHHLRTTVWLGEEPFLPERATVEGRESVADIYITDAGVPVSMTMDATVHVRLGPFQREQIRTVVNYIFSAWGQPVTIAPPVP